ncbi:MAG: hypothetical protein U0797_24080 [Gemmataceae bacterium]
MPWPGAKKLTEAAFLDRPAALEAGHNHFGPAGLVATGASAAPAGHAGPARQRRRARCALLADSPASDTLLELDLSRNGSTPTAVRALGESAAPASCWSCGWRTT